VPALVAARRAEIVLLLVFTSAAALLGVMTVPPLILLAALVPAVCWTVLLQRMARPRWGPALAMVLWGCGIAAPAALTLNDLLSAGGGGDVVPVLAAPFIEEAAKVAGLVTLVLLLPGELHDARSGIVYGMLAGIGFAAMENASYLTLAAVQGGQSGLVSVVYLRGAVHGLNHAIFTGAAGAGLGWARQGARLLAPSLGFAAAVAQHGLWNGIASRVITDALCAAPMPGGACGETPSSSGLFVTAPLVALLFLGPGGLALLAVARAGARSRA
jgi:RsiW-degrading membrane proteinase PrsW (M82 family)